MLCDNSKTCESRKLIGGRYICDHNNLKVNFQNLVSEWDYQKNSLPPESISARSSKKAWWICSKNHLCECHKWEASVCDRTRFDNPRGCPFCANKKVCKHMSLLTLYPHLCKEWNHEKNLSLPDKISPFSNKKAFWVCGKNLCGCHKWEASIVSRTRLKKPSGCPYCCNQKICEHNSLLRLNPILCKEWDYEKNQVTPDKISPCSKTKVSWICSKNLCGCHKWEATVNNRTNPNNPNGCPFCVNNKVCSHASLLSHNPELSKEWDYEKNDCFPNEISPSSGKRIWWKCLEKGHSWEAYVYSRKAGTGCPKCLLCPSCMLWRTNGKLCVYCKPKSENKLYQKTKEMVVVKFLKDNLPDKEFIHNKSVGKDCTDGHLFPDIRFECFYYGDEVLNYNLIVEIDEFQHRGASYECDKQRMYDIVAKIATPCIFIRYNPDNEKSDVKFLLKILKKYLKSPVNNKGDFAWNNFGFYCKYLYYK